jgi:DNA-binding transcriptional MerR regulator
VPELWLTAKQLGELEGVHPQTVRRWARRGLVERQRYGASRVRYRLRSPQEYRQAEAVRMGRVRRNEYGEVLIDD